MSYALTLKQMLDPGVSKDALLAFFHANNEDPPKLEKSIAPVVYFHQQALLTGATLAPVTQTYFGSGTTDVAHTNMKGGSFTLPQDEHMVVTGFRILSGVNAVINATDWDYGAINAILKNATMKVQRNNIVQANLLPLSMANNELTTDDLGRILLQEPFLWKGQTYLSIDVSLFSAPAANTNLRIEVHGIGLIS